MRRRNLKSRHLEMISIGGAIGTGLFYGSSWSIKQAGPAITIVYLLAAVAIYFIVRALGEMAVEEPVSGSFVSYANRYIGRFAGFCLRLEFPYFLILSTTAAEFNALRNVYPVLVSVDSDLVDGFMRYGHVVPD